MLHRIEIESQMPGRIKVLPGIVLWNALGLLKSPVDRIRHAVIGVPDAAHGDGIGHDVLRQRHAAVARVAQVMDIRSCHLTHQSNPAYGFHIRPFLGCADGGYPKARASLL